MADAHWRSTNTPVKSTFITGMPTMFSVPHYSKVLNGIREQKGIAGEFNTNLIEVRPEDKVAVFEYTTGDKKGQKVEKEFGFLHVTPPMGPLESIKKSPLADGAGWVDVDQGTLQHKKYENVFSLGDASSLPTSKVSSCDPDITAYPLFALFPLLPISPFAVYISLSSPCPQVQSDLPGSPVPFARPHCCHALHPTTSR
jgi:hypothetical protein